MPTAGKQAHKDGSHTGPGPVDGQPPPRSLEAPRIQSTNCGWLFSGNPYFSLFSFWLESSSEMFRQEIIYVSVFQRHSMCKRERGKRKSQYKNKSNSRWIFFPEIKNCLLLFIPALSVSFMMLLRRPFQHTIFKWSRPWGPRWCLPVMKYSSAFEKSL